MVKGLHAPTDRALRHTRDLEDVIESAVVYGVMWGQLANKAGALTFAQQLVEACKRARDSYTEGSYNWQAFDAEYQRWNDYVQRGVTECLSTTP
jgi:hypothetical protein